MIQDRSFSLAFCSLFFLALLFITVNTESIHENILTSPVLSAVELSSISVDKIEGNQELEGEFISMRNSIDKNDFSESLINSQLETINNENTINEISSSTPQTLSEENIYEKEQKKIYTSSRSDAKNNEKDGDEEENNGGILLFKRYNLNAEMLNTRSVGICVTIFLISPFVWLIMY